MRLEHISKSYGGKTVLRDVSFSLEQGVTCLMAPSGSGKTTLLRILLGLERPDKGRIAGAPARWGVMFQEDRLLEELSAMENLRFAVGPALDEETASGLLTRLGLGGEGEKAIRAYSGGMKRRLALARALLVPSQALALDEPFTGLDGENREICLELIAEAAREKAVLLVTHDEGDAGALDARIIRL